MNKLYFFIFIFFFPIHFYVSFSQYNNFNDLEDSLEHNFIQLSTNRYLNTYLFRNLANLGYSGLWGDLQIIQNYTGNAILSSQTSFRDDQNLSAKYGYKIDELFRAIASWNWLLSSDTRSIDLNKVEVLQALAGMKLNYEKLFDVSILTGYESNRQLGFNSDGIVYSFDARMNTFDFEQYKINASAIGDLSNLSNDRTNSNLNLNLNLQSIYDENNSIVVDVRYVNTRSANFIPIRAIDKLDYNVENRVKNHLMADLNLKFKIFELNSDNKLTLSNRYEDKFFNSYSLGATFTGVNRQNHELTFALNSNLYYQNEILYQSIGLFIEHRDENFLLKNKFNIPIEEEIQLRDLENQKDNALSTRRLFYNGYICLSQIDTIRASSSISLFRFDTPSARNDDDYDKLMILGVISYLRKFTNQFIGGLTIETQNIHLVNLKAKQSALNNWYRSLRLGTVFFYNTVNFSMNPRFDLIANYTIYDFEEILSNVNSISFRQIGMRDSMYITIDSQFFINLIYIFNYNERGILYWKKFAEAPQRNNFESFIKILFFYRIKNNFLIGLGGRYYNLSQKNLSYSSKGPAFVNTIFGPEVYIDLHFISNSFIRFEGWGDFQPNKSFSSLRPNFYLTTYYKL